MIAGGVLLVGAIQGLRAGSGITAHAYFQGPKDLGFVRSWFSLSVSLIGSFMVFSLVQMGAEGGLTPVVLGLAYPLSLLIWIPALRRVKKWGTSVKGAGVTGIIRARFGLLTAELFWATQLLAFFGVLAGQLLALSIYLRVFHGIEQVALAMTLAVLAPVAYTTVGGFLGVTRNDGIQGAFVLAFLGLLVFPVLAHEGVALPLNQVGGLDLWGAYGGTFAVGGAIFLVPTLAVRADIWQRVEITEPSKRGAVVVASFLTVFLFYLLVPSAGWAASRANGGNPGDVFAFIVQAYVPDGIIRGLLMASILSALVSSIDSYLSVCAGSFVRLVARRQFDRLSEVNGDAVGPELLATGRAATVFLALTAGIVAYGFPDLVDLLVASFAIIGVCTPVALVAVFSDTERPDLHGALSIACGWFGWLLGLPLLGKLAFITGILGAVMAMVGGVLVARRARRRALTGTQSGH